MTLITHTAESGVSQSGVTPETSQYVKCKAQSTKSTALFFEFTTTSLWVRCNNDDEDGGRPMLHFSGCPFGLRQVLLQLFPHRHEALSAL